MWILIAGGLMITLPALVVIFWLFGTDAMFPALASFALNMLPFVAAFLLLRKKHRDGDLDIGH